MGTLAVLFGFGLPAADLRRLWRLRLRIDVLAR